MSICDNVQEVLQKLSCLYRTAR